MLKEYKLFESYEYLMFKEQFMDLAYEEEYLKNHVGKVEYKSYLKAMDIRLWLQIKTSPI